MVSWSHDTCTLSRTPQTPWSHAINATLPCHVPITCSSHPSSSLHPCQTHNTHFSHTLARLPHAWQTLDLARSLLRRPSAGNRPPLSLLRQILRTFPAASPELFPGTTPVQIRVGGQELFFGASDVLMCKMWQEKDRGERMADSSDFRHWQVLQADSAKDIWQVTIFIVVLVCFTWELRYILFEV